MKKLIVMLVALIAMLGLTVTELVWGGSDAEADAAEIAESGSDAVKTPQRTRRNRRR